MARVTGPLPDVGRVVGCWFPHDADPLKPGGKFRPCFVSGVNTEFGNEHPKVCVIYGTGQHTTEKLGPPMRAYEFELDASEGGNRLAEQTRFDCAKYAWLPYTVEWFCNGGSIGHSYGGVPEARKSDVKKAVEHGKATPAVAAKPKPVVKVTHIPKSGRPILRLSQAAKPDDSPSGDPGNS